MTVTANDLYALGLAVGSLLRGHVDPARQDRVLDLIRALERQAGPGGRDGLDAIVADARDYMASQQAMPDAGAIDGLEALVREAYKTGWLAARSKESEAGAFEARRQAARPS